MLSEIKELAANYSKVKPAKYVGVVNFQIGNYQCHINMTAEAVEVAEGFGDDAIITAKMSHETYAKLRSGTWNGLTAAGRAHIKDSAPLDFEFSQKNVSSDTMQLLYHLGMHFFSGTYPTTLQFGPEHTRVVHGGNVTALAYGHGVRSAYYTVQGDQQINSDERDPWWQCFVVIGGQGEANIDGAKFKVQKGMAIHVPPHVIHTVKAVKGEVVELIWIAYGNKA